MRCLVCSRQIASGEMTLSCESGEHAVNPKSGHGYFKINEDVVAHARCSPWFDMTKNFVNDCHDVDECALCTEDIDESDFMVRLRVGILNNRGDIMEMHSEFQEKYLHVTCASEYFDDDWLIWNT